MIKFKMLGGLFADLALLLGLNVLFIPYVVLWEGPEINYCGTNLGCHRPSGYLKHFVCRLAHNCEKPKFCKNFPDHKLSIEDKQVILDMHNKFRSDLALGRGPRSSVNSKWLPPAANMREMVWDEELEFLAQCWANQCKFEHDFCATKSDGTGVGQNMVMATTASYIIRQQGEDVTTHIQGFYTEGKHVAVKMIKSFASTAGGPMIEHFTQMVWANTSQMGCGRSIIPNPQRGWKETTELLVCNYAPAGNILHGEVYKIGKACSDCTLGCIHGLCRTSPSNSLIPSICKASKGKHCKPVLMNPGIFDKWKFGKPKGEFDKWSHRLKSDVQEDLEKNHLFDSNDMQYLGSPNVDVDDRFDENTVDESVKMLKKRNAGMTWETTEWFLGTNRREFANNGGDFIL